MTAMPVTIKNQGYTFRYATSAARIERILELLQTPMTQPQLAAAAGMSERTAKCYVAHLLNERPRRIRVYDWQPNSPGSPTMVLIAGRGPNKPKPKPMTALERSLKRRKDPEVCFDQMMAKRASRRAPRRDPLVAAMFGAA